MHHLNRRGADALRYFATDDVSTNCHHAKTKYCWSDGKNVVQSEDQPTASDPLIR
ncbi:hypothetical protein [uncultured Corynebacterium sp.]|uniref:hypothetical protein n=1 Tax=uncultured Corynebacterium sp. TaxID=159447 RepID=UPI0025D5E469|nr:hypothetical protein [uncultured Corynebacterium sp.]